VLQHDNFYNNLKSQISRSNTDTVTLSLMLSFVVMMILDVALG